MGPLFVSLTSVLTRGARAARGWLALGVLLGMLLVTSLAAAFEPPPLSHRVTDTSGKLSEASRSQIEAKLARFQQQKGAQIAVLVLASIGDEPIEDVAFKTFSAWKLGEAGKDNGVLLVLAMAERKMRIETGKGVGGQLTDLQTNDILRQRVAPRLRQNDLAGAIDDGTNGIIAALGGDGGPVRPGVTQRSNQQQQLSAPQLCKIAVIVVILLIVIIVLSRRGGGGGGGGGGFFIFPVGGGGGGGSWGGGDSGGGDSGFSGGGGESGGGGSSDSW